MQQKNLLVPIKMYGYSKLKLKNKFTKNKQKTQGYSQTSSRGGKGAIEILLNF